MRRLYEGRRERSTAAIAGPRAISERPNVRAVRSLVYSLASAAMCVSMAAAQVRFVAVGQSGRRASSADGRHWENDTTWAGGADLFGIAFGAGRFVAVGGGAGSGRIVSSEDGSEWREVFRSAQRVGTIAFGQIASGEARFVAASGAGLLHSSDGERFATGARFDWPATVSPRRAAFGDTEAGRRFIFIGDVELAGEVDRMSWRAATTDGEAFLHTTDHAAPAGDIAHGAGRFVVVGPRGLVESSHDGQTWTRHELPVPDDLTRVVWTGSRFLASGGKAAWSSPDGLAWAAEPWSIPGPLLWAREDGVTGQFFAVGADGAVQHSTKPGVWETLTLPAGPRFEAIAWTAR